MKEQPLISPATRVCAVIGNPIAHSLSPAIHNAGYNQLGLDFVYVAHRVEDVKSALAGMRALENFRGLSVTIPHKIEVMKHVDEIEPVDRAIGSINTVVKEGGRLIGLGTDGPGALKALTDAGVQLMGKTVLMLGAGGASRAIAFTLAMKAKIGQLVLLDIDDAIREGLTSDLQSGTDVSVRSECMNEKTLAEAMEEADVILHCTPVGMHPKVDASLVPVDLFRPGQVVFDAVYTPLETKLLKDAASCGVTVISGVEMFINQAVLQFERFTGKDAPVDVMRDIVLAELHS
jgi:shikimate dehydrogenase